MTVLHDEVQQQAIAGLVSLLKGKLSINPELTYKLSAKFKFIAKDNKIESIAVNYVRVKEA